MSLTNRRQLENTRKELQILKDQCRSLEPIAPESTIARQLTVRSLKKLINQMKEEIALFECRASLRPDTN
jgi:hypothetical protein